MMACPPSLSPVSQISPAHPPQESSIPMSDSDIPTSAYRQPVELIQRRENGQVDKKVMSVHIFGYQDDPLPPNNGVQEIATLVKMLENAEIACCMAAEAALLYYGTTRVMHDWFVCVPTNMFEKAVDLVRAEETFEPFAVLDVDFRVALRIVFPRFRFVGLNLSFTLVPGKVYLLDVKPDNIERSQTGIPYPKLAHLAQGLLDTLNRVDLTDLVDGMNLSMEWGDENLDLEGPVSPEWGLWKANTIAGGKAPPGRVPRYVSNPPRRREVWSKILDPERTKLRMGFKYPQETYETRFRLKGSHDPRLKNRPWI